MKVVIGTQWKAHLINVPYPLSYETMLVVMEQIKESVPLQYRGRVKILPNPEMEELTWASEIVP